MINADLIIVNAGELVRVSSESSTLPRRGTALSDLCVVRDGAVASADGRIVWVGTTSEVISAVRLGPTGTEIDARGCVVTPGLVDAHTHPVFAEPRHLEFAMRAAGKTYQQIATEGGGIANTVAKTRAATEDELYHNAITAANRMIEFGTTTAEAKSGYGLSLTDELKMLLVIRRVNQSHQIDWIPTAMPAHDIPPEFKSTPDAYVDVICREILPAIAAEQLARFNDVFFETGVFNRDQSKLIQLKAGELGFGLKFHVDELSDVGGACLAAESNAVSADHLVYISDDGISALSKVNTVAVMLPGTCYFLDLPRRPPVRRMIEAGVSIGLATDCNPGSNMTESMQMAMNQACVLYKMSPAEALVAATHNAACALLCADQVGSLAPGLQCDAVIWDAHNYHELSYHYGVNLAREVIKNGKPVRRKA